MDFEELYSQCVERHNQQETEASSLAFVPSLREVENRLRGIRADRCGGPDGVDPSWLSRGCIVLAPAVFDLIFKCLVWRTEPIQFKGGRLTMLPKGGALRDPSNFRGIMLASSISKCIHAHLREPLIQTLSPLRPPGQLGGYPSKECSFAAQYVRGLTSICQHLKISCAVIYIDLKAAFHSLVRQLVTGPLHQVPREWQTLRTTLERHPPSANQASTPGSVPSFQRLEAHPVLIALMQELSQNAWAHLDSTTVRTARGSRPGSPLADATFHAAMLDVGWQLERVNEELIPEVPMLTQMGVHPHVLIWADDLAFPVLSQSAEELEDKVQTAFLAIQRAFHSRGFTLNYSAGKTEIVPTWVGMGAPEQRRRMLMMEEPTFQVRVQARYRHLGALQETGGGMESELRTRAGMAWTTFRQLQKTLLCNRKYLQKTRLRLLETLVFTKLFYAAGSWPPLSRRQLAIVKKAYVLMTRLVTRTHYKGVAPGVTDEKVLALAGFMDVQSRLTQERLRYAARLYRHGEDFMLKVIEAEAKLKPMAWLHQLRADWDWLTSVQGPSWGSTLEEGIQHWKAGRGGWKRFLRAAGSKHRLQQDIFYNIRSRGGDLQTAETKEVMDGYECACGKAFNNKRAWAMHATVVHGRRTATYDFGGTRCLICMQELWTTGRLRQHVT